MGQIYLAANAEDFDEESVKTINFSGCNDSEIRMIFIDKRLRDVLIKLPMTEYVQCELASNFRQDLTEEDIRCIFIANAPTNNVAGYWTHVKTDYSTAFLHEFADHLEMFNVECQDNIDIAFIEKHYEKMDLSSTLSNFISRHGIGAIIPLMHIPKIAEKAFTQIRWSTKKQEMKDLLKLEDGSFYIPEEKIDEVYNTPISAQILYDMYDNRSARERDLHQPETVRSYYVNNFNNTDVEITYDKWQQLSLEQGNTALTEIVWKDFIRKNLFNN